MLYGHWSDATARADPNHAIMTAQTKVVVTVPRQTKRLAPPPPDRVRRLKRHLIEALRDLRGARRPDRLIQPTPPEPPPELASVLRAGCAACQGQCCLGGGDHAYLDERTMARIRRDRPELSERAIIRAYVQQVAPMSYQGSCLFHGRAGCTLAPSFRATLCSSYHCDGLLAFLRNPAAPDRVEIRAIAPRQPAGSGR